MGWEGGEKERELKMLILEREEKLGGGGERGACMGAFA